MRPTTPIAAAGALLACAALGPALPAQTAPTARASQDASMRLHAAWLREMLDLDVRGAIGDYQAIANDRQSRHVRWIAVARLGELRRMGVPVGDVGPVQKAPPKIDSALQQLSTPLPVEELLQLAAASASGEPRATEPTKPFELRPAVPAAQESVRQEVGPTPSERQRQRINALQAQRLAAARAPDPGSDAERERERAVRENERSARELLGLELDGRAETAANRRALYFPDWKQPPLPGDPAALLTRVRTNLDAWIKETSPGGQQRLLQRLREEVAARAATDPMPALQFVARLPWYGERLLAELPADANK